MVLVSLDQLDHFLVDGGKRESVSPPRHPDVVDLVGAQWLPLDARSARPDALIPLQRDRREADYPRR
jgi:hypothetical protein